MVHMHPQSRWRTSTIVLVTALASLAFVLVAGGILLLVWAFQLRPAPIEPDPAPSPSPAATQTTVSPTPTRPADPAPTPSVDPAMLIEFEEFDRSSLVELPPVEPPGERTAALTELDTGLGLSIAVPEWMQPLGNSSNYMAFAAPDAWLSVERYTFDEYLEPRTIDSVLDGMGWGDYEDIETSGDDSDFQVTSRDTRDHSLRHERIVNGASDALVIRWWSDWDDEFLKDLAQQVVDSAAPTTSLDEAQPPAENTPAEDPVLDVFGYFSVPLPPGFTDVSQGRTETLFHHPDNLLWYVSVTHVATEERLSLEQAVELSEIPLEVSNTGGDADEFWWNGASSSHVGYRHYLVGEKGYIQISSLYSSDDVAERDAVEENLRSILENITIAPLD